MPETFHDFGLNSRPRSTRSSPARPPYTYTIIGTRHLPTRFAEGGLPQHWHRDRHPPAPREELQGQPKFKKGLHGPTPGGYDDEGRPIIRYQDIRRQLVE